MIGAATAIDVLDRPEFSMQGERDGVVGSGRNRELDWLRAYAILLVVATHAGMVEPYPTAWSAIVHTWFEGRTGVDLFFVISGFVISLSFNPSFDEAKRRGTPDALRCTIAFYLKRFIRLWPVAAFWAVAIFVGSLMFTQAEAFPAPLVCFRKLIAALTYTFNWSEVGEPTKIGYFYSLATEMQFYLLLPVFLFLVGSRRFRFALAAATFLLGFAGVPGLDTQPQLRFGGIVAGIALFCAQSSAHGHALEPRLLSNPLRQGLFTLAALAFLATCEIPLAGSGQIATHVAVLPSLALVGAASFGRGYVSPLGLPTILDWIGSRSYSIYACHIPIMLFCRSVLFAYTTQGTLTLAAPLLHDGVAMLLTFGAIAIGSELTYRLLEQPFRMRAARSAALYLAGPGPTAVASPDPVTGGAQLPYPLTLAGPLAA